MNEKTRNWKVSPPETAEEYQQALLDTAKRADDTLQKLQEEVKTLKEGKEIKEGEDASISLKSLDDSVTELKGEIERVRVNMPQLKDMQGNPIPETPCSKILGMDNEDRKQLYDWWQNGVVYKVLKKMDKLGERDIKEHDEYVQKTATLRAEKAEKSEAYQFLNNPSFPQMQRSKAVVTGSMGLEQTGYGLEWAPVQLGQKVIALATYDSVILQEAQAYPMSVHKTSWPTADYSEFALTWPATELEATQSDPDRIATSTFAMQARWGYVLALLGRQFIVNSRQYGLAAVDSVLTFMKHAAAVGLDTQAWTGTVAGGNVCNGLEQDTGITDVDLTAGDDTWAEILYSDLVDWKYSLAQRYRKGAKIYTSPKGVSTMRIMKDAADNLIYPMMNLPNPFTFDGTPVVEVDVANETETDAYPTYIYGNLFDTFAYGFLEDMIFESTPEKYWVEGGILFRLEFWADMGVCLPAAVTRLLFNTA